MKEIEIKQEEQLTKVLSMWQDRERVKEIKAIYAPKLTEGEFKTFVETGVICGLNPFLREIWAVKYDTSAPAQIFIGRDGYRKIISRNPDFNGIIVDAVYENDEYSTDIVNGTISHIPNMKDRGKLKGAYCIIYMRSVKIPYYVYVNIEEYNSGRSVWKEKPATMIKKVAECQCIRMADMTCAGTYSPDEMPEDKLLDHKQNLKGTKNNLNVYDGELVNSETGEVITHDNQSTKNKEPAIDARQLTEIKTLMAVAEIDESVFNSWACKKYRVESIEKLSMQDAVTIIKTLREKAAQKEREGEEKYEG